MLSVLPKVTALKEKQIGAFAGLDRRAGAKENTFSDLMGTEIPNGNYIETFSRLYSVNLSLAERSNNFISIKNSSGETDIYCLGPGGFYKNDVLLPLFIGNTSGDISWGEQFTSDLSLSGDRNDRKWTGSYKDTKLIRYGDYIFALPQMIYTDGEKTMCWNLTAFADIKDSYLTDSAEGIVIKRNESWLNGIAWGLGIGDKIQVYVDGRKRGGTFTIVNKGYNSMTISYVMSDGSQYSASNLFVSGTQSQIMLCLAQFPKLTDVTVAYNRLWGVAGNRVYASKLARPFSFSEYDGGESDAWWADTDDSSDFTAITSLNGRIVAFKPTSTFEIYGTVNPYTIKNVSLSMGCISRDSAKEANGVLFISSKEGITVYGGAKFVNIGKPLNSICENACGVGIGSKYYMYSDGKLYKYDYYTGIWVILLSLNLSIIYAVDGDLFATTQSGDVIQITGEKKEFLSYNENLSYNWMIQSTDIGGNDFYAEGINRLELRFESQASGWVHVEVSRDGGEYESYGKKIVESGWHIFSVPISFKPCSRLRYRITGSGAMRLKLVKYSYRKVGRADIYE